MRYPVYQPPFVKYLYGDIRLLTTAQREVAAYAINRYGHGAAVHPAANAQNLGSFAMEYIRRCLVAAQCDPNVLTNFKQEAAEVARIMARLLDLDTGEA